MRKIFIPDKSVVTILINYNIDNCSETDESFINELINSDDPNQTASDSEITISSMENHMSDDSEISISSMENHMSDNITSVENLNIKRCDCITRLESLKDGFNL